MSTLLDFSVYTEDASVVQNADLFDVMNVVNTVSRDSGRFMAETFNTAGSKVDLFSIGQDVKIYYDTGSPPTNQIFFGRVEKIDFNSTPNKERLRIGGRDYTSVLMDSKVQELYTSGTSEICEVGSIVRDVVWNSPFSGTITVTNVSGTTRIVDAFRIKNKSVFETVQQLAEFVGYDFWIDFNKDLHFQPESITSTGYTFDNTNSALASINEDRQEMANRVTVYGARTMARLQENFTADGGSIFTLLYSPHDTQITQSGLQVRGGVFELTTFLPTGVQYLVDYDTKRIIFVSGTDVGANVPASGVPVVIEYARSVPIIKEVQDDSSIDAYGFKETVITNTEIKDPRQALQVAQGELTRLKDPAVQVSVDIISSTVSGIQPGQTVVMNMPWNGVSGAQLKVFETTYNMTKSNLLSDSVISFRAGNRIRDTSDLLQEIILKQRELEAIDTDPSDTVTKFRTATGSLGLRTHWYISTRTLGSSFVLNHPSLGDLGSGTDQAGTQSYLGDSRGSLVIQESGGDFGF